MKPANTLRINIAIGDYEPSEVARMIFYPGLEPICPHKERALRRLEDALSDAAFTLAKLRGEA